MVIIGFLYVLLFVDDYDGQHDYDERQDKCHSHYQVLLPVAFVQTKDGFYRGSAFNEGI